MFKDVFSCTAKIQIILYPNIKREKYFNIFTLFLNQNKNNGVYIPFSCFFRFSLWNML
jgi:hypothetical protein